MNRPFIFLSGEFRATMPAVFSQDNWQHCMNAEKLEIIYDNEGCAEFFRRSLYVNEKLKGAIFYADMDNKELEKDTLNILKNFPCWPHPSYLLQMMDRHQVLQRCIYNGFVTHPVIQLDMKDVYNTIFPFPYVIKAGNSHRGIGKYLITKDAPLPDAIGIVTIEPFFIGTSVRILKVGPHYFGIKIENDNSWIANTYGAETSIFTPSESLLRHALAVSDEFHLDFAGVDYIVEPNGNFHFLEINQFPGLDISDEAGPIIKEELIKQMKWVERIA